MTGSTSGIGLATARTLAAQGANVMLNGFGEASVVIGRINDALGRSARPARPSPLWPQFAGWARDLLHGRTRSR